MGILKKNLMLSFVRSEERPGSQSDFSGGRRRSDKIRVIAGVCLTLISSLKKNEFGFRQHVIKKHQVFLSKKSWVI